MTPSDSVNTFCPNVHGTRQAVNCIDDYLGRPCRCFPERIASQCAREDWTAGRFSAEIVTAMNQAVDQMKARFQASRLRLIGCSGGSLAARRQNATQLVTVAAGSRRLDAIPSSQFVERTRNALIRNGFLMPLRFS